MAKPKRKVNPNEVKTRDYFLVAIILGATKSGVHKDKRKAANKKACRLPSLNGYIQFAESSYWTDRFEPLPGQRLETKCGHNNPRSCLFYAMDKCRGCTSNN